MGSMSGERTCSNCGASMLEAQDWCLQCGTGAPRSPRTGPGWRSAAVALGATGALVLGAAAAAYAALEKHSSSKPPTPVAQTPPTTTPPATTQTTTPPPTTTPSTTPPPSSTTPPAGTTTHQPSLNTPNTPPKIPATTPTPNGGQKKRRTTTSSTTKSTSTTKTSTTSTTTAGETTPPGEEELQTNGKGPVAVLLDADAAQVYNPGKFAAARFGDPSLAIDGDATTAWTMQLEPSDAPNVGAGLSLDLNAQLKIAQITLISETVGMTVQIYGTTSKTLPESLSSEEWVRLTKAHVVKKRKATIDLHESSKRFRQLLVWIVKAPTSSSGQFTGSDVAINELQLYEAK